MKIQLPEGWEFVGYGSPKPGEHYIGKDLSITFGPLGPLQGCRHIVKQKRWRGEYHDKYYYVNSSGDVQDSIESGVHTDDKRHKLGNYFKTKEEAEAMAEKVREVFKS